MTDNYYEEKRNFVRMQINTQVTYSLNGNVEMTYHGKSIDLSATGLLMVTEFQPSVGDQIEIVMNSSDDRLPPFVATGKVIRAEPNQDKSHLFNVSVELETTQ
ncbi:MAG: PilZ domain-containing protein [Gammaproteobacteria bacterium]|nr:PilZ domain-containing protein [Gammaproteobacteria bacterium]